MIILGIDPGSNVTGFGVITARKLKLEYMASGCVRASGELNNKLAIIFNGVLQILEKYQPDIVVVETIFMRPDRPNPQATIKLAHARGAIISAINYVDTKIVEYSANQIKKTVTGRGHANKNQILFMVKQKLKLKTSPQLDATDALACAICHAYHIL